MNKQSFTTILLTVLMSMTGAKAFPHDIEVVNDDGKTIYYEWINYGTELSVTHPDWDSDIYDKYSGDIVIPETLDLYGKTYAVTSIEPSAFRGCRDLTSVTIPKSVKSIGEWAFYECSGLKSATIPDGIKYINDRTFCGCSSLTSVAIPNSVTRIGDGTFSGCSNLETINLPEGMESIGSYAFCECNGLKTFVIPCSVTYIGERAFDCSGLTSITIPININLNIGNDAFGYHYYDDDFILKLIVNDINKLCNNNLLGLFYKSVLIDEEGNEINKLVIPDGTTSIGDKAFYCCRSLTSVVIPSSVTSIGGSAFQECKNLTSVSLPNGLANIGYGAFFGCSRLTSITIPQSVTEMESNPFAGCSSLTSIIVESGNNIFDSRDNCNAIIRTAGNELILGCKNTVIPNSVKSIGGGAFSDCSGLVTVIIPNSVNAIGSSAFSGCINLTSITIPNSVTSVDSYAFCDCRSLNSITIPNKVTLIESGVFEACTGLTSITIPDGVTTIREYAFGRCSNLSSCTIPKSVTKIESNAFKKCEALRTVKCYISEPFSTSSSVFPDETYRQGTLFVPAGTEKLYSRFNGWKEFLKIVEMDGEDGPLYLTVKEGDNERIKLTVNRGVNYSFNFKPKDNVKLTHLYFNNAEVTSSLDGDYNYTTPAITESSTLEVVYDRGSYPLGDVNGDGEVNVADHVKLSEIIMNQ